MIVLLLGVGVAHSSVAQTPPPPPETPADKEEAAKDTTKDPKKKWTEDLTVGAQLDAGRAGTKAVSITGDAWTTYRGDILRFDASEGYGAISASGVHITSMDRQYGSFGWSHDLNKSKTVFFTQIDSVERDAILLIDYRASSLNAIGFRLKKKKVAFDFGPGISLVDQQKNTPQIDGFKVDAGGFYSLVYSINPKWHVTHWTTYRNDVSYSTDRLIDSSASIAGAITKTIGMKVSVTYNYEGVLAAGVVRQGFATRNYVTTTIGLTLHH